MGGGKERSPSKPHSVLNFSSRALSSSIPKTTCMYMYTLLYNCYELPLTCSRLSMEQSQSGTVLNSLVDDSSA